MTLSPKPLNRPQVHLLYEYGPEYRPYSSSFLRLIQPLSHPLVTPHVNTAFCLDYHDEHADIVILDRLWRRDVSLPLAEDLVRRVRRSGAKFVYSIDDDFFDLPFDTHNWPDRDTLPIISFLLQQADLVITSTPSLRQRLLPSNPNICVMPNHLDERLLVPRNPGMHAIGPANDRVVIGSMGTFTHDDDFRMLLPALRSIVRRHPDRLVIQIVGMLNQESTKNELNSLPLQFVYPRPEEHEYPLFMLWFTANIQWDIAIAPLSYTTFNNCKSDIKFLDYASVLAPGIFSRSTAYCATIQDRYNGWLVDNITEAWEEALEELINDRDLRLNMGQRAHEYLYQERTLAQHAGEWVDLIRSLC